MADHAVVDERAPLLGTVRGTSFPEPDLASPPVSPPILSPFTAFTPQSLAAHFRHWAHRAANLSTAERAVIVTFASIFLAEIALGTATPAISSMLESIVCRQRYGDAILISHGTHGGSGSAIDPRCKASDVQGRLSHVLGWQAAFECLPNILFSLPYGVLADNLGRRPIMLLAWTGLGLQLGWYLVVFYFRATFPLWALWFTALWGAIGSFPSVGPAMIFTVVADVTPQAARATAYFRLTAVFLVAELISSPLAGALLIAGGHWLPLLFGFASAVMGGLVLLALPETLNFDTAAGKVVPRAAATTVASDTADTSSATPAAGTPTTKRSIASAWHSFVHLLRTDARATSLFILHNRPLMFLMVPFVFSVVGRFVQNLLLQYATKRYSWSWSQAAFLLTIRSTTNLVLCLVLLPLASAALVSTPGRLGRLGRLAGTAGSPLRKDLLLARVSGALLVLGAVLIAFAATPALLSAALVVFSLGGGYSSVMRSLLNAFVEPHHLAMLNTLLGLLEFSGLMVAAPALFAALQRGIALGGVWTGLPFLICAGMCLVSTLVVVVFRVPPGMLEKGAADAGCSSPEASPGAV
ncbi:hypothetical protein SCUCBS95973_009371 [Sporothrix curviconia]|uniref:MFS transporter n=1 Tax=Sporothrix curviconia TaxID=1260050 RepID=A0ABP0CUE2_9PEZI